MTRKTKPPTIEPVPIEPIEAHVPIIAEDSMQIGDQLRDACDRAVVAEGMVVDVGDGRTCRSVKPPPEAAIVHMRGNASWVYASFNDPRPYARWLPVAVLQPATLNGWAYEKASKLHVEPSIAIFCELEQLHGRGEAAWKTASASGGTDPNAAKLRGTERIEIPAMVLVDNEPGLGSASTTEFIKHRNVWLSLRTCSKLEQRRRAEERPWLNLNYNPKLQVP